MMAALRSQLTVCEQYDRSAIISNGLQYEYRIAVISNNVLEIQLSIQIEYQNLGPELG